MFQMLGNLASSVAGDMGQTAASSFAGQNNHFAQLMNVGQAASGNNPLEDLMKIAQENQRRYGQSGQAQPQAQPQAQRPGQMPQIQAGGANPFGTAGVPRQASVVDMRSRINTMPRRR